MYRINNFIFKIDNEDHIPVPDNMKKFEVEGDYSGYRYEINVVDEINVVEKTFVFNKNNIKIDVNNGLEKRYLNIIGDNCCYGVSEEINQNYTKISVHKDYVKMMNIDTVFVSLLSLERRMYQLHKYILHSAYVIVDDQAILFTAPSGTGKSTQAALWEKYRCARVINGDRTLISKKDNQYYACGWPICGSSQICYNESYPISCIVVLSQGKDNHIEELDYKTSFKKLLSEITINYHSSHFVNEAMNFIDDLISHVNIYHLTCDISEEAVRCLEKRLEEEKHGCFR